MIYETQKKLASLAIVDISLFPWAVTRGTVEYIKILKPKSMSARPDEIKKSQ